MAEKTAGRETVEHIVDELLRLVSETPEANARLGGLGQEMVRNAIAWHLDYMERWPRQTA